MPAKLLPDQETLLRILRYDPETGRLYWRDHPNQNIVTGSEALTCLTEKGYRRGGLLGRNVMAHRVIWKMLHGDEPDEIDHENGSKADNRPGNLRAADRQGNNRNSALRKNSRSGRIGVSKSHNGWKARIRHEGREIYLGYFRSLPEAIKARGAAEQLYGYHPNHGRQQEA